MLLFGTFLIALLTPPNKKAALRKFGRLQGSLMLSY
ncbi:hypothetical protein [Levilactobacillus brevis]